MGRGTSGIKGGGGTQIQEFAEAFAPGKDFEAVNGVDHDARTVSRTTQKEWDKWVAGFGGDPTNAEFDAIMKDYDWRTGDVYGYARTTNSMAMNKKFWQNAGKEPDEIFTKKTKRDMRDLETAQTLDRLVNTHSTPNDGTYYRFCNIKSLQNAYGLTDAQANLILQAPNMTQKQLTQLNAGLSGSKSSTPGYASYSANRSLNAFKNPTKKQSQNYVIERRASVKKGTKGFAIKRNAQESEVVFGRNFGVNFSHVTVEGNHIVIHEFN